jgi:hypothetical protein
MSHEPPIPEAARSPYPLQPAPLAEREVPAPVEAQNGEEPAPAAEALQPADEESWTDRARDTVSRVGETVAQVGATKVGIGAAIGIGSAAVVAAVMFARRGGSQERETKSAQSRQKTSAKPNRQSRAQATKRELIEPTPGDKRLVRRKADGTFGKTVDLGKSLAADRRVKAKATATSGQGDRGDQKD